MIQNGNIMVDSAYKKLHDNNVKTKCNNCPDCEWTKTKGGEYSRCILVAAKPEKNVREKLEELSLMQTETIREVEEEEEFEEEQRLIGRSYTFNGLIFDNKLLNGEGKECQESTIKIIKFEKKSVKVEVIEAGTIGWTDKDEIKRLTPLPLTGGANKNKKYSKKRKHTKKTNKSKKRKQSKKYNMLIVLEHAKTQ